MATKKEKEELSKMLKDVNNKWEFMSLVWIYRQKEIKNYIIIFQTAIILFFILKYTPISELIYKFFDKWIGS